MSSSVAPAPTPIPTRVRTRRPPDSVDSLAPWASAGVFGTAELHAAAVLVRADPAADEAVHLAAALALWAPLHGHACIDLADAAAIVGDALTLDDDAGPPALDASIVRAAAPTTIVAALPWPSLDRWRNVLAATSICRIVDRCDDEPVLDDHPLVLHGTLLYTQRQWLDECVVAADLRRRAMPRHHREGGLDEPARDLLERLLPTVVDGRANIQHAAAMMAVQSRLAVIVGGPGTGKTHTLARMLAVMLQRAESSARPIRIALAAPTGKAAARMGEAIGAAAADPDLPGPLGEQLSALRPTTIHRLLGVRGQRTRFANNADHRLDHDVVVIDEASMVALPMMARLVEALRPDTTLVLVGDPDQLESIEVGSVLADIVAASQSPGSPVASRVMRLDRSHRQAVGSPIGPLADAIRLGRAEAVVSMLVEHASAAGSSDDTAPPHPITFVDTDATAGAEVEAVVRNAVVPRLQAAAAAAAVGHAFDALAHFADVRVLCAHRRGPWGVESWNRSIESWLLTDASSARPPRYYPGRPLLVTRNDQRQRIANGDTGIIVADPAGLRAAFATADGLRLLAPAQLDTVDTAFAMTIHKSQGSEYATVVVVLPPATSALIGRELLYTAVTRSTDRVIVVGSRSAVAAAVNTPGRRVTGLARALS